MPACPSVNFVLKACNLPTFGGTTLSNSTGSGGDSTVRYEGNRRLYSVGIELAHKHIIWTLFSRDGPSPIANYDGQLSGAHDNLRYCGEVDLSKKKLSRAKRVWVAIRELNLSVKLANQSPQDLSEDVLVVQRNEWVSMEVIAAGLQTLHASFDGVGEAFVYYTVTPPTVKPSDNGAVVPDATNLNNRGTSKQIIPTAFYCGKLLLLAFKKAKKCKKPEYVPCAPHPYWDEWCSKSTASE